MAERFVVAGFARVRAPWFSSVAVWSNHALVPVDFLKCLSLAELRARLAATPLSAVMVDAAAPGVDRGLLEECRHAGAPVLVISDVRVTRDWAAAGADAVLAPDFDHGQLLAALVAVGRRVTPAALHHAERREPGRGRRGLGGHAVTVVGRGGSGVSTVAVALAQGLSDDPAHRGAVLLADFALHADQALLHDAADPIPNVVDLVEAHRHGTPTTAAVREMTFDVDSRGYALLLGLQRHRDWSALPTRAVRHAARSLVAAHRWTVFDATGDVEGDDQTGSVDVEERNALARAAVAVADVVVAVSTADLTGLRRLVRLVAELDAAGLPAGRIVPVLNRVHRGRRARRALAGAVADHLTAALATPLLLSDHRDLDVAHRAVSRMPATLVRPLAAALRTVHDTVGPRGHDDQAQPLRIAT